MIAGSVRRWRTVNRATSSGPFSAPKSAWDRTISTNPMSGSIAVGLPAGPAAAIGSRMAMVGATRASGITSIGHSRLRVSNRPNAIPDTMPVTPEIANASPTAVSPRPSCDRTSSGMPIDPTPPARFTSEMAMA